MKIKSNKLKKGIITLKTLEESQDWTALIWETKVNLTIEPAISSRPMWGGQHDNGRVESKDK